MENSRKKEPLYWHLFTGYRVLEVWMGVTCALSWFMSQDNESVSSSSSMSAIFSPRLNFTLRHMDVSCKAYDHYRHCLDQIVELREKEARFMVAPVSCSFPQFFQYERVNQLVRHVPFSCAEFETLRNVGVLTYQKKKRERFKHNYKSCTWTLTLCY